MLDIVVRSIWEKSRIRMQALPGQGIDETVRLSCPTDIRYEYPLGSYFAMRVRWIDPSRLASYLYTKDDITAITEEQGRDIFASEGIAWPSEWLDS